MTGGEFSGWASGALSIGTLLFAFMAWLKSRQNGADSKANHAETRRIIRGEIK